MFATEKLSNNSQTSSEVSFTSPDKTEATPANGSGANQHKSGLTPLQTVLASFILLSWLFLFAGGITMDTTKFRCAISPEGAKKLEAEARPGATPTPDLCTKQEVWVPAVISGETAKLALSWVVVLLFFLPLNLAMVASAAGALGTLGNEANLEDDQTQQQQRDGSSPIMSGLLRGLFVYLFFISGLLLFDDKPFSSPGPGQYIRLAGFISLFSFLVNYRPRLFATISDWALARINSRNGASVDEGSKDDMTLKKTTKISHETEVKIPIAEITANGNGEETAPSAPAVTPVGR